MKPLVSVLMVAHNAGPFLAPAAQSVLGQTYSPLELILVDNASTDGSVAALAQSVRDERLKFFPQARNLYHSGGLNAGLPHCRGEFIAIMDADDLSLPARLERQMAALAADPTLDAVGCAAQTIDDAGNVTGRELALCMTGEIHRYARFDMPFIFPTLLGKRRMFEAVPPRTELIAAADFDFVARAVEQFKLGCLGEALFSYRRHSSGTTSQRHATLFAEASLARLAKARRLTGQPENFSALIEEKNQLLAGSPTLGQVFAHYAGRSLAEGFLDLAVFHARKAGSRGCPLRGASVICRALIRGRRLPSEEFRFLRKLALRGPLVALDLKPVAAPGDP
ncbi:MAG: glycosyltransferase family 2 protein [Verrucomicrobia bacterium]|nr:glycosyltransferase family 2 protein [Verrucomicrobiota bacterium]